MKKFFFLALVLSAIISTNIHAQAGADPDAVLQQMKERVKPQMLAKTGLTDAQADKVIEINFEIRQAARGLRDLNEADRTQKIAELKAAKEKKYSEIPLTAEQIKTVHNFFEELAKNAPPKPAN